MTKPDSLAVKVGDTISFISKAGRNAVRIRVDDVLRAESGRTFVSGLTRTRSRRSLDLSDAYSWAVVDARL
jgi:hypothetical protein